MRRTLLAPAWFLSLVACAVGPRFADFLPAHAPEGVRVEVYVLSARPPRAGTDVKGELLEVRKEGLLVLGTLVEARKKSRARTTMHEDMEKHVVLVPFDGILEARFEGMGARCELRDRTAPAEAVRDRLRLVSRFPQGLAPDLLRLLLEAHGQAEIQRLGP